MIIQQALLAMMCSSQSDSEGWRHESGYVTVAKDFRLGQAQLRHQFASLRGYLKVFFALLIIANSSIMPIRRTSGILRQYAVVNRVRWASTAAPPSKDKFKIVVLGGGASRAYHDLTQSPFDSYRDCIAN